MLQIDHIYQVLSNFFGNDFSIAHLPNGVLPKKSPNNYQFSDIISNFNRSHRYKILCYDQEPLNGEPTDQIIKIFRFPDPSEYSIDQIKEMDINTLNNFKGPKNPYFTVENLDESTKLTVKSQVTWLWNHPDRIFKDPPILITSEKSKYKDNIITKYRLKDLYYFFHGFAALDWFRGYHALNFKKPIIKNYKYDYQSFNRIVTGDRAYRKTFVDQLRANDLLEHGAVSYGVTDDPVTEQRLVIDHEQLPGSASADIPDVDAFWHIVTETVFYYDKLHLTEKIFKPIVSKQPFMLLAAPGNLEYLRSYGFKTFEGIIDESYDTIEDNDARIDAVVKQIKWYCSLTDADKFEIQRLIAPIVEYNFQHFYGKFKEIITDELLDNTKKLFKDIGYNDSGVDYATVRKLLTS